MAAIESAATGVLHRPVRPAFTDEVGAMHAEAGARERGTRERGTGVGHFGGAAVPRHRRPRFDALRPCGGRMLVAPHEEVGSCC